MGEDPKSKVDEFHPKIDPLIEECNIHFFLLRSFHINKEEEEEKYIKLRIMFCHLFILFFFQL